MANPGASTPTAGTDPAGHVGQALDRWLTPSLTVLRARTPMEMLTKILGQPVSRLLPCTRESMEACTAEPAFALQVGTGWWVGYMAEDGPAPFENWEQKTEGQRLDILIEALAGLFGPLDAVGAITMLWKTQPLHPLHPDTAVGWSIFTTLDPEEQVTAQTVLSLALGMDVVARMRNFDRNRARMDEVHNLLDQAWLRRFNADLDYEEAVAMAGDILCQPQVDHLPTMVMKAIARA